MIYGYARVSTKDQKLTTQKDMLKEAGAGKIYSEKVSTRQANRKQLSKLLDVLESGDTLIITKMDRVSRNLKEGIELIDTLTDRGVIFKVLNMGTFDNTPSSKMIRNILLSVAEWERDMARERQYEGIQRAKEQGKYKGRPKTYNDNHRGLQHALELFDDWDNNKMTVDDIADITGISRATIYREAKKERTQEQTI